MKTLFKDKAAIYFCDSSSQNVKVNVLILPGIKDAGKQDDGSNCGDDLLVAFCAGVEGEHTHRFVPTVDLQD